MLLGLLIANVDPFAIFEAERKLKSKSIYVPRETLTHFYLLRGQVRTLVELAISAPATTHERLLSEALIIAPDESKNPKFVAPIKTGIMYSAIVLLLVATGSILYLSRFNRRLTVIDFKFSGTVVLSLVGLCLAYGFMGAAWGRETAKKIVSVVSGVALYFLIRIVAFK